MTLPDFAFAPIDYNYTAADTPGLFTDGAGSNG